MPWHCREREEWKDHLLSAIAVGNAFVVETAFLHI